MSEYKSLDDWFPDGKPDGRKFTYGGWGKESWFQPFFRSKNDQWYGLDSSGHSTFWNCDLIWEPYNPPKKTKKVTLYKPIRKGYDVHYRSLINDDWHTDKQNWDNENIVGWMEIECEVLE